MSHYFGGFLIGFGLPHLGYIIAGIILTLVGVYFYFFYKPKINTNE